MNVGKSIKLALVNRDMTQKELAKRLDKSVRWINQLANTEAATSQTINMLATAFDMKASEFVALGED